MCEIENIPESSLRITFISRPYMLEVLVREEQKPSKIFLLHAPTEWVRAQNTYTQGLRMMRPQLAPVSRIMNIDL